MPRTKRKPKQRRLTADDYFVCGWLTLLCGWREPKGDYERQRARAHRMETREQVREAWELCREKLMGMRSEADHEPPDRAAPAPDAPGRAGGNWLSSWGSAMEATFVIR